MNDDIKGLKVTDIERLHEHISKVEAERDALQLERDEARSHNADLERRASWADTLIEAIDDFERGLLTFGELVEKTRVLA